MTFWHYWILAWINIAVLSAIALSYLAIVRKPFPFCCYLTIGLGLAMTEMAFLPRCID